MFYPPVVLWVLWLTIRYRSTTLFTAANPAMPAGGFIGESKVDILDSLPAEWVASYCRIPGSLALGEKLTLVRNFVEEKGLEFPLVLKPDAGQRGTGVKIVGSWAEVEHYCQLASMDFLAQEYIPGLEFGVFYVRRPSEASGQIISITEKRLPFVKGDGRSTIEELVLADDRAVCLSSLYLETFGSNISQIPEDGQEILLAELGTHCRGAVFTDGGTLSTPSLEAAIDRLSKSFEGFFFGRYDIRVATRDDFQQGVGLRVVELNGVTSEATHIYDRKNSVFRAWSTLFRQWRLAFEIGRENRDLGHPPASLPFLWQELSRYRRDRIAAEREDHAE